MTEEEIKQLWIRGFKRRIAAMQCINGLVKRAYRNNSKDKLALNTAQNCLETDFFRVVENIRESGNLLYVGCHV